MAYKNNSDFNIAQIPDDFDVNTKNCSLHLSINISKLGVNIPSINLPPIVTCNPNAPCIKCAREGGGCYATKGHWRYRTVRDKLWNNLYLYKNNPDAFFADVVSKTRLYKYVRWFGSGDIVDYKFFIGMVNVANINKDSYYLCFTKKTTLVNEYLMQGGEIPENLKIVFSCWRDFIPENPFNLPMTYVMFGKGSNKQEREKNEYANSLIPKDATLCSGDCEACLGCWQLEKGQTVVFKKH